MTTTIWMPLIDLTQEMGIMKFASKSQLDGYLPQMGGISDESESRIDAHVEDAGLNVTGETAMKAGDATFHSGWTLHRAPSNQTETMREVITIIYFPDGTRILEPDHENRRVDLKTWLVGRDPGDLADGELNPLLYSRDPQI
jgi:ectoine hydroxylase-related dioxygenase (phytanoyl-CoA dioxygenase family)